VGRKILIIMALVIIIVILLIVIARFAGYRPMKYPADTEGSMYPAISSGDLWLVRMERGYSSNSLKPGMVIIFRRESYEFFLTKRIIALENQTVTIKGRETFVNGDKVREPYAFYSGEIPTDINLRHRTSDVEAIKVPPGKLFVMGDNRDDSFDSRDPEFGFVDVGDIVAKPILILWARDRSRIGKSMK